MKYVPKADLLLLRGMCQHAEDYALYTTGRDRSFVAQLPLFAENCYMPSREAVSWQIRIRKAYQAVPKPPRAPRQKYVFEPRVIGLHKQKKSLREICDILQLTLRNVDRMVKEYRKGKYQFLFDFLYETAPNQVTVIAPLPVVLSSVPSSEIQLELPILT